MNVRSLGYRTDLLFPRFEGEVIDRGAYIVVRTPSNPGFFWGNYLLFSEPPRPGDLARWGALFREEIVSRQPTHHVAFGIDTTDDEAGDVQPFLDAGFQLSRTAILTARGVHRPPRHDEEVVVRPVVGDEEWRQALENQVTCQGEGHETSSYRPYKERQMVRYRRMVGIGQGAWFGAFLGERLVADLGLFWDEGRSFARFQAVGTHPEFRRRGICGALVYGASRWALDEQKVSLLVMAAEESHPQRIYESVGFAPTELQVRLEGRP